MNTKQIERLIQALKACEIKYLVVVPASGLELLYQHFERDGECLYATREEEAIAIASGLSLGGKKSAVVMAQAGVGNCLNAVLTLAEAYGIGFPVIVCFRGEQDPNLVQRVSARETHLVLDMLKCAEVSWETPEAVQNFKGLVADQQRWIKCWL
jgi:sulfopyruvate decarboxylase TPP-binding subunit